MNGVERARNCHGMAGGYNNVPINISIEAVMNVYTRVVMRESILEHLFYKCHLSTKVENICPSLIKSVETINAY